MTIPTAALPANAEPGVTLASSRSSYAAERYGEMSLAEAQISLGREAGTAGDAPGSRRDAQATTAAGVDALFVAIVQRHYDAIVRYIHGMVPVPQQAEDLAQDTFLKAYVALSGSDVPANTRALALQDRCEHNA